MDEFDPDLLACGPIGLVVSRLWKMHLEVIEMLQKHHLAVLDKLIEVERAKRGPGVDHVFRNDGADPRPGGPAGRSQADGPAAGQHADLAFTPHAADRP